jgi:hypothetical protein
MLSAAKHLVLRPFASLRVTHKCANLAWFDLGSALRSQAEPGNEKPPEQKRYVSMRENRGTKRLAIFVHD